MVVDNYIDPLTYVLPDNVENAAVSGPLDFLYGNGLDNTLIGNSGANRLDGQGGNDTIIGGAGIDTAVYSGNRNDYTVGYSSGTQTFTLQGLDGSTDTVKGVEYFEFADGTLTAAQLQSVASLLRTVNVVADHASAKEGETGSTAMHFVITLSGASTSEQTLHYVIAGAGVAPVRRRSP